MTLEEAHATIASSSMFLRNGPDIDLPQALIDLCNACNESTRKEEEFVFDSIGEHTFAPLGYLVVGAWHALTLWHAGQWSPEYAAMCALGQIYRANGEGMTPDDPAWEVYEACNEWFARKNGREYTPATVIE